MRKHVEFQLDKETVISAPPQRPPVELFWALFCSLWSSHAYLQRFQQKQHGAVSPTVQDRPKKRNKKPPNQQDYEQLFEERWCASWWEIINTYRGTLVCVSGEHLWSHLYANKRFYREKPAALCFFCLPTGGDRALDRAKLTRPRRRKVAEEHNRQMKQHTSCVAIEPSNRSLLLYNNNNEMALGTRNAGMIRKWVRVQSDLF